MAWPLPTHSQRHGLASQFHRYPSTITQEGENVTKLTIQLPIPRLDQAAKDVINNANQHEQKHPALSTLFEEFAEAILAARGKHEHPLRLELVQIAGICINLIRQIDSGTVFTLRIDKEKNKNERT